MTEKYTLIVKATDPITDETVILRGKFRVFGHQERYFCSVNMINTGMQPIPIGGCLEYIRVGNTTNFTCKMDGDEIPCMIHNTCMMCCWNAVNYFNLHT